MGAPVTPPRLPPPAADDIPRPVPGPDEPPAVEIEINGVRYDDEIEVTEDDAFPGEKTALTRRCLGCGQDFLELDDDVQPPSDHAQAWGRHGGRCRGTRDPNLWAWCRGPIGEGRLEMPGQGIKAVYFSDRRKVPR